MTRFLSDKISDPIGYKFSSPSVSDIYKVYRYFVFVFLELSLFTPSMSCIQIECDAPEIRDMSYDYLANKTAGYSSDVQFSQAVISSKLFYNFKRDNLVPCEACCSIRLGFLYRIPIQRYNSTING